jgi:hypothetical protein
MDVPLVSLHGDTSGTFTQVARLAATGAYRPKDDKSDDGIR